jgi:DNA-entry nuclease
MARRRSARKLVTEFIECILVIALTFVVVKFAPYLKTFMDNSTTNEITVSYATKLDLSLIPSYTDKAYVKLNNNIPDFDDSLMTTESFEKYSDFDSLGRCGVAFANIGKDLMPTKERESIGMIKPSGWRISKYDFIDGKYLFNRCHLIGYQLTGENANEKNLITGTRYLNVDGMLPFENKVADYVKSTNNHVLYRVTPHFEGNNPIASGVQIEAKSVEDNGKGIQFNVYCYNVQPRVKIDYATGENSLIE